MALPGLTPTTGFPIWLAFIVLAVIMVMALWTIQSRQEEQTGRPVNKVSSAIWAFLIVVAVGWFVTSAFISDQAIMTASSRNISSFDDFESIYVVKVDKNALAELGVDQPTLDSLSSSQALGEYGSELSARLKEGELTPAEAENLQAQLDVLNAPAITLCSVSDTAGEINAASELRQRGIPVRLSSQDSMGQAGMAYAAGDCDLLAGGQAELAAERAILEEPNAHQLTPIQVTPSITNIPAPAGFNIQGGVKLTPEFASVLFGLFVYHGAFAAELVRAGILSVSKGQSEAARALGLSEGQRLRLIVLPQALRVIIPPMTSNYLSLAKNSSLAVAVGYPDLVAVGNTVLNQSGLAVQVIVVFMVSYLTISLIISAFLNWYNKKVALVER
jgi:general L-amino acid transport system permease protein